MSRNHSICALGVMLSFWSLTVQPVQAAIIAVTSTAGTTSGPECTIRDAFSAANSDRAVGGCPAGNGADTILLMKDGVYTLTEVDNNTAGANGLPAVSSDITVEGHGATLRRAEEAPDFRFFFSFGSLTLRELEISNGSAIGDGVGRDGGVIRNSGNLLVDRCTLVGNAATAVAGGDGGAIGNFSGHVTVVNSTISGNRADRSGGGVYNNSGQVDLIHVTAFGNAADFGGGLDNFQGQTLVSNSLIVGNTATTLGLDAQGNFISNGFNLVGALEGSAGFSLNEAAAVGFKEILDPRLAENGGPTPTHALIANSPAIDRGDPEVAPPTDQRGVGRWHGVDVGAFEFLNKPSVDPAIWFLGEEFQPKTFTTGNQAFPSVAATPDGRFMVVWPSQGSWGTDQDGYSAQGRCYAAGIPSGDQFQINTFITGDQGGRALAGPVVAASDTRFLVVWSSSGSTGTDSSGTSIQGRLYPGCDAPISKEFQINTRTAGSQTHPAVGVDSEGDFIVVWSGGGIAGQRFSSNGEFAGPEFDIAAAGSRPAVDLDAEGNFVVTWQHDGAIYGRRFTADGKPLGPPFQVDIVKTGSPNAAAVAVDGDGDFVVAWDNGRGHAIQGRFFASDGTPGEGFLIANGTHDNPALSSLPDGGFLLAWHGSSLNGEDSSTSIQGLRFSEEGGPAADQFQINTWTPDRQGEASVSITSNGLILVAWESAGADGDQEAVRGQCLSWIDTAILFEDGFESGDVSAWSAVVP